MSPAATPRPTKLQLATPPASDDLLSPSSFLIASLILAAAIFAVYAPSLGYHFILDDHRFTGDPRIQSSGHLWDYFTNYVWAQFTGGPASFYRPMFVLWVRLNFVVNEMSPWGWHFLSICKHVAVAALLGLLVWRLLRDRAAALLAAALFALHPAQTESVAWVTVPDPLLAIGVLATLLLYLRYAEGASSGRHAQTRKERKKEARAGGKKPAGRREPRWLIAAAVACFLTLLTKETAIILPVELFIWTLLLVRDEPPKTRDEKGEAASPGGALLAAVRWTIPFGVATVAYFMLRLNAFGGKLGSLTQHIPWSTVVLSWPVTLWFYAKVLLWPVRSYAYADPTLAEKFSVRGVLLPGLGVACLVAGLAALVWWTRQKSRRELPAAEAARVEYALLLGVLLLVLPILLALNLNALNPGDFLHGRYVYLPSVGLMMVLAAGWHLAGRWRRPMLYAAGCVAIAFAALSVAQERQWKDDLTLFTAGHELAPNNPWVAANLEDARVQQALGMVAQGRCSEVLPVFEKATRDYPTHWYAWAGLGYCYFTLNDLPKAEEAMHQAARLSKDPRTIEQWQELRAHMGLPTPSPLD